MKGARNSESKIVFENFVAPRQPTNLVLFTNPDLHHGKEVKAKPQQAVFCRKDVG